MAKTTREFLNGSPQEGQNNVDLGVHAIVQDVYGRRNRVVSRVLSASLELEILPSLWTEAYLL